MAFRKIPSRSTCCLGFIHLGASALSVALLTLLLGACQPKGGGGESSDPPVVDVEAKDFAFQVADTVRPGWTTFRMPNEGTVTHFMILYRLPEGITYEDYTREVLAPFDSLWHDYRSEDLSRAQGKKALVKGLPRWLADTEVRGGPGFVSPGGVAQATVRLESGEYWMECYVKTPDGTFHTSRGMVHPLTVAGDSTESAPPEADLEVTLSNEGIQVNGTPAAGRQTIQVQTRDHPKGALFLKNDIHVVRLDDQTDIDEIARWMDAWRPEGLRTPAPAEFVGGAQDVPAGDSTYFSVDLTTGRYAWIAEVPKPQEKGMLKTFTIE